MRRSTPRTDRAAAPSPSGRHRHANDCSSPAAPASSAPTSCTTSSTHTDATVTVLDKLTYAGNRASLDGPARRPGHARASATSPTPRSSTRWSADADAVVHFAAESHNDNSLHDPRPFLHTNLVGTFTLLEAVRRHGTPATTTSPPTRCTATSSSTTRSGSPRTRRTTRRSPYSSTKAGTDLLVRAWVRSFGVRATISNCSNNYGPYQHVEKFIPRQITNVLDGIRPKLYGAGAQRPRLDPRRRPLLRGADASSSEGRIGETYLIGADGEKNNQDGRRADPDADGPARRRLRPRHRPRRPRPALRDRLDQAAHRARLAAARTATSRPAWPRTIDWYRANEDWWRPQKDADRGMLRREGPVTGDRARQGARRRPTADPGAARGRTCPCTATPAAGSRRTGSARR